MQQITYTFQANGKEQAVTSQIEETEQIQFLLGNEPSWFLLWGNMVIFIFVVIGILLSLLIRYPDVFPAPIEISTSQPPISVIFNSSGKLSNILVENKQMVQEYQLLALLDNAAKWKDISELENILEKIQDFKSIVQHSNSLLQFKTRSLGDLSQPNASLCFKIEKLNHLMQSKTFSNKVSVTKEEIEILSKQNKLMTEQKILMLQEKELTMRNYNRNLQLNKTAVISNVEMEKATLELIQKKRDSFNINSTILSNELSIQQLEGRVTDLQQELENQKIEITEEIIQEARLLLAAITVWKQKYALFSPVFGQVDLYGNMNKGRFIMQGDTLLSVVPKIEDKQLVGKVKLPIVGAGKVKLGTMGRVTIEGFPKNEYGTIEAKVKSISIVPKTNYYYVEVSLPSTLKTSFGKIIPKRQNLNGSIELVLEDKSLAYRIFGQLISILQ